MINKIYSFLGLIHKSGNLSSGDDTVENDIKRNKCKLLLIAEDSSENTKKKFLEMSTYHKTNCIVFGKKDILGQCIGKSPRAVLSIKNEGFAKELQLKIHNYNLGGDIIVKS